MTSASSSSSWSPMSKLLLDNITEAWSCWNPPMPFIRPAISKRYFYTDYQILAKIDDSLSAAIFSIDFDDEVEEVEISGGSILKVVTNINSQIRAFCVYWLIYAAEKLNVSATELHHGIDCFDRYLSGNAVDQKNLHFVGLACLLTASTVSQMGESKTDPFKYVHFARNVYTLEEFCDMKDSIQEYLELDNNKVIIPTTLSFVNKFVRAATDGESKSRKILVGNMACYLAELSLLSRIGLKFRPSWVAASCVFLARYIIYPLEWPWDETLQQYTLYRASHMRESVLKLHAFCYRIHVAELPLFREKYGRKMFGCPALMDFPKYIPLDLFQDREFSLI